MQKYKKTGWLRLLTNRRTVQTLALVLSNAYYFSFLRFIPCGYLQCSNCAVSTFSCPLILIERGAVMAAMGMTGGMLGGMSDKFMGSAAGAVAMLLFFGALFGSFGCGWLCPFGFIQDLLGKIPVRKFTLPAWTGHLRLLVLAGLVIVVPYLTHRMFFCDICPPGTINRLWQQAAGIPMFFRTPEGILAMVSILILVLILVAAIFINRPFCSLFCPIGGVYGLMNTISGIFIRVDPACVECGRCAASCPQGIDPATAPAHPQCSRCLECTSVNCRLIQVDVKI